MSSASRELHSQNAYQGFRPHWVLPSPRTQNPCSCVESQKILELYYEMVAVDWRVVLVVSAVVVVVVAIAAVEVCSPSYKVMSCQAVTAAAALTLCSAVDCIQAGSTDVRGLQHSTDYLHLRLRERACGRSLHFSDILLLAEPFTVTDFSRCAFMFSLPSLWNSPL